MTARMPNSLRALSIMPASAPALPRKFRRFQKFLMVMGKRLSSLARDSGNTIDFHERVPGKLGNGYRGSRGAAIREIRFEDFVHAIVVVDLGQLNGELKNAVHRAAAGLDQSLDVVHHLFGVGFDVGGELPLGIMRMGPLASDVDCVVV